MRERAVTIECDAQLAAIVTLPNVSQVDPATPGVLILNEGILHRIGAGRLHVKFARMLAQRGFVCMRMDHSSIGDSGPRRGSKTFEEAAVEEVRAAMDYLSQTYGLQRFLIYGLCSGSDVAFELAIVDDRVAGIMQLDAHVYTTRKSRIKQVINHYGPRIFRVQAWRNFLLRVGRLLIRGRPANKRDALEDADRDQWYADPEYSRIKPPKPEIEAGLKEILRKQIPMYVCFSGGGYYGVYNYDDQYRDAFPNVEFGDLLTAKYLKGSTHLFTALSHQEMVMADIDAWLTKHELVPTCSPITN